MNKFKYYVIATNKEFISLDKEQDSADMQRISVIPDSALVWIRRGNYPINSSEDVRGIVGELVKELEGLKIG